MLLFVTDVLSTATLNESELRVGETKRTGVGFRKGVERERWE